MSLLAALLASYTHPGVFDHYYSNSISLIAASSSSSCLSQKSSSDILLMSNQQPVALPSFIDENSVAIANVGRVVESEGGGGGGINADGVGSNGPNTAAPHNVKRQIDPFEQSMRLKNANSVVMPSKNYLI